jgi:lipoprotein-anchoring transpeptidase ErfK/SrfK
MEVVAPGEGITMMRRLAGGLTAVACSIALVLGSAGAAMAANPNPHKPGKPASQSSLHLPMKSGDRGAYVRLLQERLQWLGYELGWREVLEGYYGKSTKEAVRRVQDKFFMAENGKTDESTWNRVKRVSGTVGELPRVCRSEGQVLCIDKTSKLLRYVRNGKVVQTLDVRFGVPGLDTPEGSFRVWYRWRDATSGINGPGQPRAPMPYALFFAGSVAVHYSPTFASSGYYPGGGSHGCVNVADLAGVRWLFDQIPVGTLVHVYWS